MHIKIALAAITLLGSTVPALAKDTSNTSSTAPAASSEAGNAGEKDKRYCVKSTITGTRMATKTCLTKQEWADRGIDIEAEASRSR
jgi:hypothetical protein